MGPGLALFLDQIGARRAEKFFWRPALPLSQGLKDQESTAFTSVFKIYFKLYTVKELVKSHSKIFYNNIMVQ